MSDIISLRLLLKLFCVKDKTFYGSLSKVKFENCICLYVNESTLCMQNRSGTSDLPELINILASRFFYSEEPEHLF